MNVFDKIEDLSEKLKSNLPMKVEFQSMLDKKFRLEFNYNSNHMEGNTLTYTETELLLIFDETKGNHTLREYEEMKAHDVAVALVKEWASEPERPLTESNIKNLNQIILVKPYWKDAVTFEGQKTKRLIKVGDYKEFPNSVQLTNGEIFEYASVTDTPILMQELVDWYRTEEKAIHPVTLAAMLHYKFVRIHPFDDGNGRIARLIMNYVLLKYGFPPVIIKSADKSNYVKALHFADAGNYEPFIEYIAEQLVWSLEVSIKAAKGESIEDPDDLEKEISLMEREVEVISSDNIKTNEVVRNIWNYCLSGFLNNYLKRFSSFEKLFNKSNTQISYTLARHGSVTSEKAINDLIRNPNSTIESLSLITVYYFFEDMKKLHFNATSHLYIHFNVSGYTVTMDSKKIERKYNQVLDDAEIQKWINERADDFLKKIRGEIDKIN